MRSFYNFFRYYFIWFDFCKLLYLFLIIPEEKVQEFLSALQKEKKTANDVKDQSLKDYMTSEQIMILAEKQFILLNFSINTHI